MWQVQVTGPWVAPQVYRLAAGATCVVGRGEDVDLVLPSEHVSRRHALITATDSGLRISDLGSRNGTLLNGRPVGSLSRPVQAGDVVKVGNFLLKFEPRAEARPQPRAADPFITLRSGAFDQNPFITQVNARVPDELMPPEPAYGALLFQLAESLARGAEVEPFLREVLSAARAATGFEGGVLLGPSVDELEPLGPVALDWSRTILETAVSRRSTLLAKHLPEDEGFKDANSVSVSGHLHVLCAPFLRGEAVCGALYLFTRKAPPPAQEMVEFVGSLARLAAGMLGRQVARPSSPTLPPAPLRRLADTAEFLGGVITELSRVLVSSGDEPRVLEGPQLQELRDLLEEGRAAARQLSAELNPRPAASADKD